MRSERKRLFAATLVFVAVLAVACSKSSGVTIGPSGGGGVQTSPPPTASQSTGGITGSDLSGTWTGIWTNNSPDHSTGSFELQWQQQGSVLSGTITIHGTPCLTDGTITGALNGKTITFGAVAGQVQVGYTGSVSGTTMSGTYTTACGNAVGTWQAAKSA
jgi:hypothetical protein